MTELITLLNQQYSTLTSLKLLILEEKQALTVQDADKILNLARDKVQLLNDMQQTDKLLANHPNQSLLSTEPALVEKVAETRNALAECKELNHQNASLIELNIASLNRFAQALQVSRNSSSLTYNDKGKTSTISTLGNDFKA